MLVRRSPQRAEVSRKATAAVILALAVPLLPRASYAQDAHYWTNQYGTKGVLLGGAVVGKPVDLAATYYNPGSLALIPDPDVFLGAKMFEWTQYSGEGGRDGVFTGSKSSIRPAPSFFAGLFKFSFLRGHRIAYSIFTRQSYDLRVGQQITLTGDSLLAPGIADFVGEAGFDAKLTETWSGLTWSHRLARNASVGVTTYVAIRSQRQSIGGTSTKLGDSTQVAIVSKAYDYNNWRLLWKAGLAYEIGKVTLGLTVTTPSVNLFGSGSSSINIGFFGFDVDGDGSSDDVLAAADQDDVSSLYKSPLSIGLGAAADFGARSVYVSAEWFNSVGRFDVLPPQTFAVQTSPDDTLTVRVSQELDAVTNFAVGYEEVLSEKVSVYGSFTTDFTAAVRDGSSNLSLSTWNIFYFTGGAAFQIGRAAFTLGIGYGFSADADQLRLPIVDAASDRPDLGLDGENSITYRRWTFLFGFEF